MKALTKGSEEVLRETEWPPFVKAHLDWMQSSEGYVLVQDYVEPVSGEEFIGEITVETPAEEEEPQEEPEEILYEFGGKQYTASQLKEIISKL